jgi:hypothetical protein
MPNWCSNHLCITGTPQELKKFAATLNTEDDGGREVNFSFHQTVPIPNDADKGDWDEKLQCHLIPHDPSRKFTMDYQRELWGVKWGACDVNMDDPESIWARLDSEIAEQVVKSQIDINFDTPWGPPYEWLVNVSGKFPSLTFSIAYSECGMDFWGDLVATEGSVVEDDCRQGCEFNEDEDGFYEPVGEYAEFLKEHNIHSGG